MKKFLILALALPILMFSQEQKGPILSIYQFTLKEGNQKNFFDGMKKWKKCYLDNGGKHNWNVWSRVQGEGSVVGITFFMDKWAEMDQDSEPEISKVCDPIVYDELMPNIVSSETTIARVMPNWSRETPSNNPILNVTYFKLKDYDQFKSVVDAINPLVKKYAKDRMGTWFDVIGGEKMDYFFVSSRPNFADMDIDRDGGWDFYEKENGKAKTEELRQKVRNSTDKIWSYMYRKIDDLSNSAQ